MEDTEELVIAAFGALGVTAAPGSERDVDLVVGGPLGPIPMTVKRWGTFPDSAPLRNRELRSGPSVDSARMVVADRITAASKRELDALEWSWLDLRGHLKFRGPGMIVDADVPAVTVRQGRTAALAGAASLDIACALLAAPGDARSIRGLAARIGRAPSTVSEVVGAMRREGLVSGGGLEPDTELFWAVAAMWPTKRTYLREPVKPGSDLAAAAIREWALTGDAVAAAYGAPVAIASTAFQEFYLPSRADERRARLILGEADARAGARTAVRVAPVRAACEVGARDNEEFPMTGLLFAALDLAADGGRGREILDAWQTPARVW